MSIVTTHAIRRNLKIIEKEFDEVMGRPSLVRSSVIAAFYSKLAIMEVGGWVEQTVDDLLHNYIDSTVADGTIRETLKKEVVGRVFGFRYGADFRPLFEKIIGAARYEEVRKQLSKKNQDNILSTKLSELSKARDSAAHTYWRGGTMPRYAAPSSTREVFEAILPIMRKIEQLLQKYLTL